MAHPRVESQLDRHSALLALAKLVTEEHKLNPHPHNEPEYTEEPQALPPVIGPVK